MIIASTAEFDAFFLLILDWASIAWLNLLYLVDFWLL